MRNSLDDLDFTKLGEEFDQKNIKKSPLLVDDHDDTRHDDDIGHTDFIDKFKEPQLPRISTK
jgi:hypothetical protein